jgi:hypothetical protein
LFVGLFACSFISSISLVGLSYAQEHAWLEANSDGQIYLRVIGLTRMNGKEVQGRVEYSEGDKIQLGNKDKLVMFLQKPQPRTVDSPAMIANPDPTNSPPKVVKPKKKVERKDDESAEKMEVDPPIKRCVQCSLDHLFFAQFLALLSNRRRKHRKRLTKPVRRKRKC